VKRIAVALLLIGTNALAEEEPTVTTTAPRPHPNPRLKLSYRRFAVPNLDGDDIWLDGAQLDAYALSRRWIRLGVELEGGVGKASLLDIATASLSYGLAGVTLGFQYPWRVTPFVEGRFAGGVLSGKLDGDLRVAGVDYGGTSAITWMYLGGVETGVELYTFGRFYLSGAIGWVRTTWHGPDVPATEQDPMGNMHFKEITGDSFTFKVGLGL
jgi:hypothetical protein